MNDLYNSYSWLIPVICIGAFVFIATAFAFRKEICHLIKNTFYPTPKRYAIPSGILSRVTGTMPPYKEQEDEGKDLDKILEEPLKVMKEGVMTVPSFSEYSLENAQKSDAQKSVAAEAQPAKEHMPLPEAEPLPINNTSVAEVQQSQASVSYTQHSAIITQKMDNPFVYTLKWLKAINYNKPVINDRALLIIVILGLIGFNLYLGARVKLMYAIQHRQFILIQQMQNQVDLIKFGGKKPVILYKIPANER